MTKLFKEIPILLFIFLMISCQEAEFSKLFENMDKDPRYTAIIRAKGEETFYDKPWNISLYTYLGYDAEAFIYEYGTLIAYGVKEKGEERFHFEKAEDIMLREEREGEIIRLSVIRFPGSSISWDVNGTIIEGKEKMTFSLHEKETAMIKVTVTDENGRAFSITKYYNSESGGEND